MITQLCPIHSQVAWRTVMANTALTACFVDVLRPIDRREELGPWQMVLEGLFCISHLLKVGLLPLTQSQGCMFQVDWHGLHACVQGFIFLGTQGWKASSDCLQPARPLLQHALCWTS